ncbi:hypothetical protein [Novipirellula artificiosorum]|uniref:SGNH hydrolase-type esterase domain-containing protein n=1 Tax=Novipirellula artificiosorum TaxID=2528016 RepID=A0A5C6E0G6_9BACT|nr:hypothetical protein [Novipirellula artificiosorum]TWU42382.1 hypothetical protein Poly41_06790 [Novipirellula artificiosorum]
MKMTKHTISTSSPLLLLLAMAVSALGAEVIPLRPNDVTTMVAGRATRNLGSSGKATRFTSSSDTVTWTVGAPQADDYAVSVIYMDPPKQMVEVRCGSSTVTAPALVRTWPEKPLFMRQELPGVLHLRKGENQIQFRLPELESDKPAEGFVLWSIELGTPAARLAQLERAKEIRGDASWMIAGKYGLFVHWSSAGYALNGNQPRSKWHEKAVNLFDVKVFADAVERTGAAWVVFTAIHAGTDWAGPNEALEKIRPGSTTKRDLIGEIITELEQRGIRTLLYMNAEFARKPDPAKSGIIAVGDTTQYGDDVEAVLRDASLRYGKKLAGVGYIDGGMKKIYPLDPPWERWARAIKAGNPDAVVGISSNRGPTVSPFSELAVTDGGRQLSQPEPTAIGPGRQLGDVTPAWWCAMDSWIVEGPMNGKIGKGPRFTAKDYVSYFKQMETAKIPVTINLAITADVVADHPIFNPDCMAIMEDVRKAIRGKLAYSNTRTIKSFVVEERMQGEAGVEQIVLEVDIPQDENYEVQFKMIEGKGTITSHGNWAVFTDAGPGQYVFEAIVTDAQGAIANASASYQIVDVDASKMYFDKATWIEATGKKTYDFVARDPSLPDVLIIGDSISVGYTNAVRRNLQGIANVYRIPENGGDTLKALNRMHKWLAGHSWDVISFNSGLHDLKYTLDGKIDNSGTQVRSVTEYKANLKKEIELLVKSGAKLLWTNTTIIPKGAKGRVPGDEIIFNHGALEVLQDYPAIAVNDLYTESKNNPERQQPANVHFTPEGYETLGSKTASNIESLLN